MRKNEIIRVLDERIKHLRSIEGKDFSEEYLTILISGIKMAKEIIKEFKRIGRGENVEYTKEHDEKEIQALKNTRDALVLENKRLKEEGNGKGIIPNYEAPKNPTKENVNHPSHYTTGKFEVLDYIQDKLTIEEFEGYCIGNVMKYISRWRMKNGKEDLMKAQFYLNKVIKDMKEE